MRSQFFPGEPPEGPPVAVDLAPVPPPVAMEPPDFIAPEDIELPDDIEPDFIGAPFVDTGLVGVGLAGLGAVGEALCARARAGATIPKTATAVVSFNIVISSPGVRGAGHRRHMTKAGSFLACVGLRIPPPI